MAPTKITTSISSKIILYMSLPAILALAVTMYMVISSVGQQADRHYTQHAQSVVRTVKALVSAEDLVNPIHFRPIAQKIVRRNPNVLLLHLHVPKRGKVVTVAVGREGERVDTSARAGTLVLRTGHENIQRDGSVVEVHSPVFVGGKPKAVVGIYFSAAEELRKSSRLLVNLALLSLVGAMAMSLAVYLVLFKVILKPLSRLERATRRLATGGYETVPAEGKDEISSLAEHFNEMVAALRKKEDEANTLYGKLERLYKRARSQAITDELTGLYNMRYFRSRLEEELGKSRRSNLPLSLAFIDLDNFKNYNDCYGHQAGDRALKLVAETILALIRTGDLAARYGGEELIVMFPETSLEQAGHVCERIRSSVNNLGGTGAPEERRLSVSIGVAAYPEQAATVAELISLADRRMYEGKQRGKNQVVAPRSSRTIAAAPIKPA